MALTKFKCKCTPIVIQEPVIKAWWKVAWQKQGSYFFEFFKFLDFPWLFPCPFLLFDDHRFSCHFLKLWKLLVTCFSIFLALNSSTETNSGIHQNGCRSHCLITPLYLTIIILALSSVVTNLPNKTLIFHDLEGQKIIKFHDFPGLENEILKFHNFPGFPWPLLTQPSLQREGVIERLSLYG